MFFHLAASQAIYQSFLIEDAFGLSTEFVWFENFQLLFGDAQYLATFWRTMFFSFAVAFLSMSIALILAGFADRVVRGATTYRTLLIWPYAVAPGAGRCALGLHVQPDAWHLSLLLDMVGYRLEPLPERQLRR